MRGYIKRIGAMPAEARTAAGENGFENRIGAMLAEIRTAAGKKGREWDRSYVGRGKDGSR